MTISGRVFVWETGTPVPDLLIAAYAIGGQSSKEDQGRHVGRQAGCLRELSAIRLGSATTDAGGSFEIRRELSGAGSALVLFVITPDGPGGSRILHATEPRSMGGEIETYLVRLLADTVRRISTPETSDSPLGDAGELLERAQREGREQKRRWASETPFSQRYRELQRQLVDITHLEPRAARPPLAFDFSVPMRMGNGTPPEGARIEHQRGTTALRLIRAEGEQPVELQFAGIQRYTASEAPPGVGIFLSLEPAERRYRFFVPRSPTRLFSEEAAPSALYEWFVSHPPQS